MSQLNVGVEDHINPAKGILLAVQHVLAMDLYVMPIILGSILGLATQELSFFIAMGFLACGIATIIQAGFGIKLPVVQGAAYMPLGALAAIGTTQGVDVMIGSLIPGAILVILFGFTGWYSLFIKKFVPPFIGGVVLMVIGVSLIPTVFTGIFSEDGGLIRNSLSGMTTIVVLIVCVVVDYVWAGRFRLLSLSSVILAIIVGCIVAMFTGGIDFSSVLAADWIQFPMPLHFGIRFDLGSCLLMIFIYMVLLIDTTATWIAVSDVTGVQLEPKRVKRAVVAEGLGCLIGSFFGGTPVTGYSSNVGILSITKVGSRRVIVIAGVVLIVLALMPKLMTFLACIPAGIINGVFLLVCMILIAKGVGIIQSTSEVEERKTLIIGAALACTIGAAVIPASLTEMLPEFIRYFLGSGTALGATVAIVLQIVLPKNKISLEKEDQAPAEPAPEA